MVARRRRARRRRALLRGLEVARGSRVVTMIHRQESMRVLGIPFGGMIDIDDAEQVLRAIRLTPDEMPIDLILHTPGGLVLASDQIAYALKRHAGKVTVMVPHYAMSGGTLVALAADEILMDRDAVLGPVDPQLGGLPHGFWPAASILAALEAPNPNRDDDTLILGDMSRKAIDQVHDTVRELLLETHGADDAERIGDPAQPRPLDPRLSDPLRLRRRDRPAGERPGARRRLRPHDAVPAARSAPAIGRVRAGALPRRPHLRTGSPATPQPRPGGRGNAESRPAGRPGASSGQQKRASAGGTCAAGGRPWSAQRQVRQAER